MEKYRMAWEPWVNPMRVKPSRDKDDDDDDDDDDDEGYSSSIRGFSVIEAVGTHVNDANDPGKVFNLWVCHTNFNLKKNIIRLIERLPGVEVLKVISRYRFIVGVGKMFIEPLTVDGGLQLDGTQSVRASVETAIRAFLLLSERRNKAIIQVEDKVLLDAQKYKFWAVYKAPNGNSVSTRTNQEEDKAYDQRYKDLMKIQKLFGGSIRTHVKDEGVSE